MPELSRFYGISIYMYYMDHDPPHIHVKYNSFEAVFSLLSNEMILGFVPNRVSKMVIEWMAINSGLLLDNWERCKIGLEINKIKPLI